MKNLDKKIKDKVDGMVKDFPKEDIKDLAWEWEFTISRLEYPPRHFAIWVLCTICHSYLMGRGIKTSTPDSFTQNAYYVAMVQILVLKRIGKAPQDYSTLVGLGFKDMDSSMELIDELNKNTIRGKNEDQKA